jgi:hypothetical protein
MRNKFEQDLHIDDFNHVSDNVFIDKVLYSFGFLLVMLCIKCHFLIEQIQKLSLNFRK